MDANGTSPGNDQYDFKGELEILRGTQQKIAKEAGRYTRAARWQKRWHYFMGSVLAVLAVAAPSLVTWQTTQPKAGFPITVIVVTAVAGAGATLQSVFRWGDHFRRTRLTALELEELSSMTNLNVRLLEREARTRAPESAKEKFLGELTVLNENATQALQAIIRKHIESEVALTTPLEMPETSGRGYGKKAAGERGGR